MSNNVVQDALEKLRKAKEQRAREVRDIKDRAAMFERNTQFLCDLVHQELPLKSRDECVLLTDEEYAEYARKHFGLQLTVVALLAMEHSQKQADAEAELEF